MPWCPTCAKFWNPNSLTPSGQCQTCGHQFPPLGSDEAGDDYHAPWHFKLMVALAVIYVSWRIVQLITWYV